MFVRIRTSMRLHQAIPTTRLEPAASGSQRSSGREPGGFHYRTRLLYWSFADQDPAIEPAMQRGKCEAAPRVRS